MRLFFRFWIVGCMFPAAFAAVDFNREIRPILSDNCFACHGPDEKQRQVGLRLDTREGAFAERGGSAVIVPGDSSKSRLFQRISTEQKAVRMPPAGAQRTMTAPQIELIRRWIDEGAKWETHWAYVPPTRPELPAASKASWERNPIDRFVLARLERENLKPSPEAGKVTLLRRVSFDLTGLPPSVAEVDAFLADKSKDAYEKVVDRLLASSRYGERMAMHWLDLARYADTHGFHIDSHRDMWRWRDWVIGAFNRNLSFDRFTIEQLAGDLLPGAGVEQKIATGFNRNHMINFEGGAIPDEYLTEYVVDRVETTSTVWMGMTMGCARCHDHKYDPIKQKEFYSFFAFFNTVPEKGLDGRYGNAEPMLPLPSAGQRRRLDEVNARLEITEKALPDEELNALQAEWEKTRPATLPEPSHEGIVAHYELDHNLSDISGFYHPARSVRGEVTYGEGAAGEAGTLSGETQIDLANAPAGDHNDPFSIALWAKLSSIREMAVFQKIDLAQGRRGMELVFSETTPAPDLKRAAYLHFRLIHRWPDQVIEIKTKERLLQNEFHHVVLNYDGSGKASGLKLYVGGKPFAVDVVSDNLTGSFQNAQPMQIGNKSLGLPFKGQVDDLRVYRRLLGDNEIENLAIHYPIRSILSGHSAKRSKDRSAKVREYFLSYDAPEKFRKLHAEWKSLTAEKAEIEKAIPTVMVMDEMEKPRETFILGRGDYRNKTEKVAAGVPSALPPLPSDAPPNRLGLAKWLLDPNHPLTARVAVNRYWQMHFGMGLVKTSEDFGSQGEAPSHPELLDWLATEFVQSGWNVKAMQRLIVTSATYRQSSQATPELQEKDPENRLLARGARFRLPAEMVRDNALSVSGLLNGDMFGPSVFPYQPKGLWEETAYGDVYSAQSYTPGTGQDLYRRSMYTFWKRTSPPPSLATFDAPDREKCTARRARTNTPLQALVLLNDPTYVEAARALAQRMILETGRNPGSRIRHGFRLATARKPESREVQVLRDLAERQEAVYARNPEAANELLGVGESKFDPKLEPAELAAWTTVASAILNLDETITKE
ncbi:MAG: DUF1553 domain-containing protein [Bryobacteraceae bacterium]